VPTRRVPHALRTLPPVTVSSERETRHERQFWTELFNVLHDELYRFMRPAARNHVDALCDAILHLAGTPSAATLIHGNFGDGNVLCEPATH
jgi:hypothetical protein